MNRTSERMVREEWDREHLNDWSPDRAGEKFYLLTMFPYPSGDLHIGHWYAICPADAYARYQKMRGKNVFFPMGFDAFGLPAENAAIKHQTHPGSWTFKNIERMKEQMRSMGCMFPDRYSVTTCEPDYYKWNQYFFIEMFRRGLAYREMCEVIYCPSCKTSLAREQAQNGKCERCDTEVGTRQYMSWKLRITKYKDELLNFDGLDWPENVKAMQRNWLENLHDWNVSRQRMWGTPIPFIHCNKCGPQPEKVENLPVLIPKDVVYKGHANPLATHPAFMNVKCPKCAGPAMRDCDTLDTFFDSSWYQYAYIGAPFLGYPVKDTGTAAMPWVYKDVQKWCPVDLYTGGIEHACMHLIYFRFFTKVLADMGLLRFREPAKRLVNQGMILGADHQKMSKSRGNVVDPDNLVNLYGADVVRLYLMFLGPWSEGADWNPDAIRGVSRFLRDVEDMADTVCTGSGEPSCQELLGRVVSGVTDALEDLKFNVAIAHLMTLRTQMLDRKKSLSQSEWNALFSSMIVLLSPFAPHATDSLYRRRFGGKSVHREKWPEAVRKVSRSVVVVQVDGKRRAAVEKGVEEPTEDVLKNPVVQKAIEGVEWDRFVVVPNRIVNLVTKGKLCTKENTTPPPDGSQAAPKSSPA